MRLQFITTRLLLAALVFARSASLAQEPPTKIELQLIVTHDYLALHAKGTAPSGATALEYRWAETGDIADAAAWQALPGTLAVDGAFTLDIKLEHSRWAELQVRALANDKILAKKEAHSKPPYPFVMLTDAALAAVPEAQRASWQSYRQRSIEHSEQDYDVLAKECRSAGMAASRPAPHNSAELELDSDTPEGWFASDEARKLADVLISFQTPTGGWSKAIDNTQGPRAPGTHWTTQSEDGWHYCGTLDNRTTTEQIKVLAGVFTATQHEGAKAASLRGIEYVLEAQYPNGGWPQNYPIEPGYHEAITLNDNAMLHALELLITVADGKAPFGFTEAALRQRAQVAFDRGITCLAAAQVHVDGIATVWCAQHHPTTLAPESARLKEPASLSGAESTELLKFLMRKAPLRADITAMIEPALVWLAAHRINGLRKAKNERGKTDYLPDTGSSEVYWARFYNVKTGQPMFAGSNDGIVYATYGEMAAKNKVGYDYFTTKPQELLSKEVARWKKRKK